MKNAARLKLVAIVLGYVFIAPAMLMATIPHAFTAIILWAAAGAALFLAIIRNHGEIPNLGGKTWAMALAAMLLATATMAPAVSAQEATGSVTVTEDKGGSNAAKWLGWGVAGLAGTACIVFSAGVCAVAVGGLLVGAVADVGINAATGNIDSSRVWNGARDIGRGNVIGGFGTMMSGTVPGCADLVDHAADDARSVSGGDYFFCSLDAVAIAPIGKALSLGKTVASNAAKNAAGTVVVDGARATKILKLPEVAKALGTTDEGIRVLQLADDATRLSYLKDVGLIDDAGKLTGRSALTKVKIASGGEVKSISQATKSGLVVAERTALLPESFAKSVAHNAGRVKPSALKNAGGAAYRGVKATADRAALTPLRSIGKGITGALKGSWGIIGKGGNAARASLRWTPGTSKLTKFLGTLSLPGRAMGAYNGRSQYEVYAGSAGDFLAACEDYVDAWNDAGRPSLPITYDVPGSQAKVTITKEFMDTCISAINNPAWLGCVEDNGWPEGYFVEECWTKGEPPEASPCEIDPLNCETHDPDGPPIKRPCRSDCSPQPPTPDETHEFCKTLGIGESQCNELLDKDANVFLDFLGLTGTSSVNIEWIGETPKGTYQGGFLWHQGVAAFSPEDPVGCSLPGISQLLTAMKACGLSPIFLAYEGNSAGEPFNSLVREDLKGDQIIIDDGREVLALNIPALVPISGGPVKTSLTVTYGYALIQEDGTLLPIPAKPLTKTSEHSWTAPDKTKAVEDGEAGEADPEDTDIQGGDPTGEECKQAGGINCRSIDEAQADEKNPFSGFGDTLKYWWIAAIMVVLFLLWRGGAIWRVTGGRIGKKPDTGPEAYKDASFLDKVKASARGEEPKRKLKPEFVKEGVPVRLPANKEGTGPDYGELKRRLEDEDA